LIDDDIPYGRDVKGYVQQAVDKALAQEREQRRREQEQEEKSRVFQRVVSQMPDYQSVVSNENIAYLELHYPEVARGLAALPADYQKLADVYSAIKRFVPATQSSDAKRAERNLAKPQYVANTTANPGSEAGSPRIISEEQRRANYQRMLELARSS
jgi:hypothetical protein